MVKYDKEYKDIVCTIYYIGTYYINKKASLSIDKFSERILLNKIEKVILKPSMYNYKAYSTIDNYYKRVDNYIKSIRNILFTKEQIQGKNINNKGFK
jgi:hypothetical protein